MISIIIPVLNEAAALPGFLQRLQQYRGQDLEIILVDGGSGDASVDIAKPMCDLVMQVGQGRARQMNAGAKKASGDILLFLHADTFLPENFMTLVKQRLSDTHVWGRFDIRLSGTAFSFRVVEVFMNFRSRWTAVATGDQAIFVQKHSFQQVGGFQDIPLMEDVALSKTLRKITAPACIADKVVSSSRRWERFGIWRTIFLMWRLRLAYFFGADPQYLAEKYE